MVEKNLQTEIFLELVFSVSGETDEQIILKKSIPLYLRKLNCFFASVLKDDNGRLEEVKLVPYAASKSDEWMRVKAFFLEEKLNGRKTCPQYFLKGYHYYGFCLNSYGVLILGRKKPFDEVFVHELKPVADHLGKVLNQARQIEKREKAENALKASEEKLNSILNAMDDLVFVLDKDNRFISYYASEDKLYKSSEEFLGKKLTEVMPEYLNCQFVNVLPQVKSGKVAEFEYYMNRDGVVYWYSIKLSALFRNGEYAGLTAVSRDITKRKKAETDLIAAKDKAEESDRLKSAFLANMSHEIRTPMNGILGFVNLLNEPNLSQEQIGQYSAIINQSGERLLTTINDIIDISKIEAGEIRVSISEISIDKEVEELYAFFKPEAKQKGLDLTLDCFSEEEVMVITDSHKLNGILTNLIKNAIKFTEHGQITIGYGLKNGFVEFYVKDTGIGIAKNRVQAVFNRFEQADIEDLDVYEGSGLGLAISKAYVEMLGGEILVRSEIGVGSEFVFTIPYVREDVHDIDENEEQESRGISPAQGLNLLIVEDEIVSAKLLETILKDSFRTIYLAANGLEAVELCKSKPEIDLILMDVKMPKMNGYKATQEIRKFNSEVLIVAQTGFAMFGDRDKAIDAGCNEYITKPIDKKLLLKIISNLIS